MENNFVLETDFEGVYFVGNRETGEWGLSNLDNTNNALKGSSRVFSEKPFKGVAMIALNMGRKCNFDCTYCLVGDLKNEGIRMSEKVGIKAIERIIELNSKKLQVVFHGSEPMMNYSLIKKLVSYANNSRIQFCMQSNGSLFNSKNLKFLSENNVGIGISIDGLKEHQNKTRRYKNNLSRS